MTVDIEAIDSKSLRYSQKIRDKYDDNSLWLKLTKGPLGFSLYAALQYPKVFLKRLFSEKSLNPTWTIREETSIRILKWTLDAPLAAIRKNFTFIEYIMKTFGCSEPYTPIKDVDGVKGYWLGPERWKNNHPDAIILYIHGGGYVATSSFFGIRFLCYLIKHLRIQHGKHVRVLAIDYDLAPEEPFPNSLSYIKRAYEWLTEEKLVSGDKNVFLCGDSSGANMVLGLLQLINLTDGLGNTTTNNDHDVMIDNLLYYDNISIVNDKLSTGKKSPLAGAILISPWIELSCEKLSRHKNSKYDYLSGQFASISAENYLFGKIGNPSRLQKLYQQPINEASILSWLEKVEDSFDFVDIDDPYYYEQKLNTTAATTSVTTTAAMNNRTSVLVNDVFEQFSKGSERTSKSSYKTTRTSFRSPRNSKVVRNSSTLSVIIDSYLNTKTFTHNIDNNNNNYYKDYGHNNDDDLDTTKKMSTHHVLRLQQIIEKNKTEISRKQSANNLYANPLVSPLHIKSEVLAKFPPLFISYGGKEIFKDDIEAFCKKCIESKSSSDGSIYPDVTIETDAEMIHAYPIFIDVFGEHSKNTLNHIASFISSKISPLPPTKLSYINSVREYRKESISGFTVSTSAVLPSEDDYSGISARDLLSLTSDGKSTNTLLEPNKNNKRTPNSLKLERNFSRQVPNSRLLKSKTNKYRKHRKMNLGI